MRERISASGFIDLVNVLWEYADFLVGELISSKVVDEGEFFIFMLRSPLALINPTIKTFKGLKIIHIEYYYKENKSNISRKTEATEF